MKLIASIALIVSCASAASLAQVPVDQLAKPPADARHFIIQSTGGKHGDSWSWLTTDGKRMSRESLNLRGQVWEMDAISVVGADGMLASQEIRGVSPSGDAGERFSIADGKAQWRSPIDSGSTSYSGHSLYASQGGPVDTTGLILERLLASPGRSLDLLPGGRAHATRATSLEVVSSSGATQTINLWAISGITNSPLMVWADANDKFFALTLGLAWLPDTYAGEQKKMEAAQAAATAVQTASLAKALVQWPADAIAFVNVQTFDAEHLRFLKGQAVVVDKGVITAVGPVGKVKLPKRVRIIDARGKTLVPGMWDCHMHVFDDYTGLQELSMGVTSIRDPGNNDANTIDRRKRIAAGQLLFPHVYASSLIDGKGPYTAQVANVANSQGEAIALVDKASDNGFKGVKFYGTFNPAWLPAAIAEAHKRGLHVHGHIPAGIRPLTAIEDGYDEVTHINWIIMQAMPDSVIAVSNGIMRFEGPGRYGKDVDLDAAPMTAMVGTMAKRHIYSDPTMTAFESVYVPENGDLSPSYAPFVGTLPPVTERNFRSGGFAVPKDLTRADFRASWSKMVALLGRMHRAGVPIVAGTDDSGVELIHELEIYADAGFTPAEALAAATIVPARLLGVDAYTGSIKVGKAADLALVDGDPSKRLGDLRYTSMVMLDGKLLDADALRTAAGYSGRPR